MKKALRLITLFSALCIATLTTGCFGSNSNDTESDTLPITSSDVTSVESNDDVEYTASSFDTIEASSYANWSGTVGYPKWAFDGDINTAWQDGIKTSVDSVDEYGVGEWLKLYNSDGKAGWLNKVTIYNGYQNTDNNTNSKDYYELNSRVKGFSLTFDDGSTIEFELVDTKEAQTFSFEAVETSSVTFTILSVYEGKWSDTCISEISYAFDGEIVNVALDDGANDNDNTTADNAINNSTTATTTVNSSITALKNTIVSADNNTTATTAKKATTTTAKKATTTTTNNTATTTTKKTTTTTTTRDLSAWTSVTLDLGNGNTTIYHVLYQQEMAEEFFTLLNEYRTGGNAWYWDSTSTNKIYLGSLRAYTWDDELAEYAKMRVAEIGYEIDTTVDISHNRADGSITSYSESIEANIYQTTNDVSAQASFALNHLMESDDDYSGQGHRRHLLGNDKKIGIACGNSETGWYCWVVVTS